MRSLVLVAACLALSACGKGENEPGPGGVTVGEAKALDEAAQMLEERNLPSDAIPAPLPTPGAAATPSAKPAAKP